MIQSLRVEYGLETYRYLSAGNFSNITPRYWLGAMHSCKFSKIPSLTWSRSSTNSIAMSS